MYQVGFGAHIAVDFQIWQLSGAAGCRRSPEIAGIHTCAHNHTQMVSARTPRQSKRGHLSVDQSLHKNSRRSRRFQQEKRSQTLKFNN